MLKEIPELLEAEVISQETADKIRKYYQDKGTTSGNRLFVVFGVLGALLVGLGIILIVAHNWDDLPRMSKTILAFVPLLLGQFFCAWTLLRKEESRTWQEGASTFLFLAVGSGISLVAQIYNIHGDLSAFLLTWSLLGLPLVYIMKSSIASLLYLIGIGYYAIVLAGWSSFDGSGTTPYMYWALLFLILPHYYHLYKTKPHGNFMILHNWIIPISVTIMLGTLNKHEEELMVLAYVCLFSLFYSIGKLNFFTEQRAKSNGFRSLGSLGIVVMLLALSFDTFWVSLKKEKFPVPGIFDTPEFWTVLLLSLAATWLLFKNKRAAGIKPVSAVFAFFIICFIIGLYSTTVVVGINILLFVTGLLTVRDGARQDHLGILNYGLLMITGLVVCRFFDTDLSFILRGLMFISVGAGFFAANYFMLKKRKTHE